MSDKYGAEDDPACYPGTTVLRNLLDIRDPDQLQQAEAEFAAAAADAIEIGVGPFDLDYLRQLHRNLFGEVYPWAGQLRQVDISKGSQVALLQSTATTPDYRQSSAAPWSSYKQRPRPERPIAAIHKALEDNRWNKTKAAAQLGITFRALRYKLKKLGIE